MTEIEPLNDSQGSAKPPPNRIDPLNDSSGVAMWERTVPHDPANVAAVLRELADMIEQADGRAVLVMLASTGFGEPWEAHIQAVLDWGEP